MNPLVINHLYLGTINIRVLEDETEKHLSGPIISKIRGQANVSNVVSNIQLTLDGLLLGKLYSSNS